MTPSGQAFMTVFVAIMFINPAIRAGLT